MAELEGSNTAQLLIEKSAWFITVQLLAALPMQECSPLEREKPPKSPYPSVCKCELSSEGTSSLSLPLSSDFIQRRLFFQKNKTPESTSNQTAVTVAEQAKGRGKKSI